MKWLPCYLLIAFLGISCASSKIDRSSAHSRLKVGDFFLKNSRYDEALAEYNSIKQDFPYSPKVVSAELRIADVYFKKKAWSEAETAYTVFRELHPAHKNSDYVIFKIAESIFKQLPSTVDRDIQRSKSAALYYNQVLRNYPQSPWRKDALRKNQEVLEMLAQKEIYIADFYFQRKKYVSALGRYKGVVTQYPKSSQYIKALKFTALSAHYTDQRPTTQRYLTLLKKVAPRSPEFQSLRGLIRYGK